MVAGELTDCECITAQLFRSLRTLIFGLFVINFNLCVSFFVFR